MAPKASVADTTEPELTETQKMALAIVGALDQSAKKRELEEAKRTKNNPNFDAKSVFRPDGEAHFQERGAELGYSQFLRQPFFNNARVDITQLEISEIQAYNALSRSLKSAGDRRTSRNGRWEVKVSANNDQMQILIPCKTEEDRTEVNGIPLRLILAELTSGDEAPSSLMLLDQVEALRKQVAAMEAKQMVTA